MTTKELKEFEQWVRDNHPDILDAFVNRNLVLDTTDKTPFPLEFSPEQEKVIDQIWYRIEDDKDKAPSMGHCNWKDAPYIGDYWQELMEDSDFETHEHVGMDFFLDDVFPLDMEFCDDDQKEKISKMTNGQINEILIFLRDTANTSFTY